MERLEQKYTVMINAGLALERSIKKYNQPPAYADQEDRAAYETTLIKRFEPCYEMTWKFLKIYLKQNFGTETIGSKDVFRQCLTHKILGEAEVAQLLAMIEDRNLAAHDYDQEAAGVLCSKISSMYYPILNNTVDSFLKS
jgi:nucleotidyltransferase substrate binding protein (TIGR01987 family)